MGGAPSPKWHTIGFDPQPYTKSSHDRKRGMLNLLAEDEVVRPGLPRGDSQLLVSPVPFAGLPHPTVGKVQTKIISPEKVCKRTADCHQ